MNSWTLSLVLAVPALLQGTKATPSDGRFTDAEIKDLGGLVMKYFRAKEQGKGEEEGKTLTKFSEAVEALQKKKKGDALLKSVKDWERILDLSEDYAKDALTPGTEGVREISVEDAGKIRFFISVPKSYDKKEAAALLLAIPDNGKDNPKDQFAKHWNVPAIKDSFVVVVPQMPEDTKTWTEPEGFGRALLPFSKIIRQVHIDCNKLFIAGVGVGAKSAAVLASNFPSRWAGAIFRGEDIGFSFAESFFNLPVYASKEGDTIKTLGSKLTELGGSFTQGEDDPAKIASWAADKVRNLYPTTVMLRPANPRARSAYWVQLEQWETTEGMPVEQQQASLKATIDREKNQITVTTNAIKSFVIYFNDAMVDLDKPVHVVTNGKDWVGTIPRSYQYFLDLAYKRNDNRLIYVRHQYFDAPPPVAEGSTK